MRWRNFQIKGLLDLGTEKLEYRMIGPRPDEGADPCACCMKALAASDMWDNFPDKLAQATGCGVFVYSRAGYGQSIAGDPAA